MFMTGVIVFPYFNFVYAAAKLCIDLLILRLIRSVYGDNLHQIFYLIFLYIKICIIRDEIYI